VDVPYRAVLQGDRIRKLYALLVQITGFRYQALNLVNCGLAVQFNLKNNYGNLRACEIQDRI
jgi:hypothetical protein